MARPLRPLRLRGFQGEAAALAPGRARPGRARLAGAGRGRPDPGKPGAVGLRAHLDRRARGSARGGAGPAEVREPAPGPRGRRALRSAGRAGAPGLALGDPGRAPPLSGAARASARAPRRPRLPSSSKSGSPPGRVDGRRQRPRAQAAPAGGPGPGPHRGDPPLRRRQRPRVASGGLAPAWCAAGLRPPILVRGDEPRLVACLRAAFRLEIEPLEHAPGRRLGARPRRDAAVPRSGRAVKPSLPPGLLRLVEALRAAEGRPYLVGGAVRDALLGLPRWISTSRSTASRPTR